MTKAEMIQGLRSGKTLIQAQRCSSEEDRERVDDLAADGKVNVSEWEFERCNSCGFEEMHRRVTWRAEIIEVAQIEGEKP